MLKSIAGTDPNGVFQLNVGRAVFVVSFAVVFSTTITAIVDNPTTEEQNPTWIFATVFGIPVCCWDAPDRGSKIRLNLALGREFGFDDRSSFRLC